MTILVTGGAGYIGSHTLRLLRSLNRDVVVLDSLVRGNAASLLGATLEQADICDSDAVADICRRHNVETVVHFAAYKSAGESMTNPGIYWRNNVFGTAQLVEGMLAAEVKRIVFSSSAAVYGNPTSLPITEDSPISPENAYAETKAVMERLISWYGITHDLRWVSLRYFNAAGASADGVLGEDWSITSNLMPLVMKAALGASGALKVFGDDYATPDGTGIRDYIHVEDLARAHVAAIDHLAEGGSNETLNLGTGRGVSVLDIISAAERVHGARIPYEVVGRRAGDPSMVYADASGAQRVLGWTAERNLDDIVESAYRFALSRRH